jgi:hypothetical protein
MTLRRKKFEERLGQEAEKTPGLDVAVADIPCCSLIAVASLFLAKSLIIFALLTVSG